MSQDMQQQIDALKAEVAELQARVWGDTRLGPRTETAAEVGERTRKVADALIVATKKAFPTVFPDVPPVDRTKLCTTSGEPVAKVRTEQTEKTGQHKGYVVLCEEERQKGFVRPYRNVYKHQPCGTVTTMGRALSETYARDPTFYGATFCGCCNAHFPLDQFVWIADGTQVGS